MKCSLALLLLASLAVSNCRPANKEGEELEGDRSHLTHAKTVLSLTNSYDDEDDKVSLIRLPRSSQHERALGRSLLRSRAGRGARRRRRPTKKRKMRRRWRKMFKRFWRWLRTMKRGKPSQTSAKSESRRDQRRRRRRQRRKRRREEKDKPTSSPPTGQGRQSPPPTSGMNESSRTLLKETLDKLNSFNNFRRHNLAVN